MSQQFGSAREAALAGLKVGTDCDSSPYEGIWGTLPAWVPVSIVASFQDVRFRLLVTAGYPLSKIQQYVQAYSERIIKPVMIGVTPIPSAILYDISWLCLLKDAVAAGPERGMRMLLGETSAKEITRGRNNIKALSQKNKRRILLPHSNKTIKNVVEELASNHPGETATALWDRFSVCWINSG